MPPAASQKPEPTLPRRVLVTGAAGFIGGVVARRLLTSLPVEEVVALDVRPPPVPPEDPRVRLVVADLRNRPAGLLEGVEAVIHCAFRLRPSRDAAQDRAVNVTATADLLAACARAGVRHFVYTSSAAVYGARPGAPPHPETDPLDPVAGFRYGEHKAAVERILAETAARHPAMAVTALRTCTVLAPGAVNFVTDLLALRLLPVSIGDDPEMQFLHVDDLARAAMIVLTRGARGAFNLAGGDTIAWREVIRLAGSRPLPLPARVIAALADLSWKAHLQTRSPAGGLEMIRYPWLADLGQARRLLDWEPQYTSRAVVEAWSETRQHSR